MKFRTFYDTGTLEQDKGLISLQHLFQSDCPLRSPILKLVLKKDKILLARQLHTISAKLLIMHFEKIMLIQHWPEVVQPMQKVNFFSICKC